MRTRLCFIALSSISLALACGEGSVSSESDGGANSDAAAPSIDAAPDADSEPTNPLDGVGEVLPVRTLAPPTSGGNTPFTEGPVWLPVTETILFTDQLNQNIHELTLPDTIVIFRENSGAANGLYLDSDGLLLAAEHQGRRVSRTLANGTIETVANMFEGSALHSPNDIVTSSSGTIYFTDPPFGGNPGELDFNGVFRVAANGELVAEERFPQAARPNGIGLSPDGTKLYVADTTDVMYAWDVAADGSLSNRVVFNDTVVPDGDGMAVDRDGNLWVTTTDSISVLAADGTHWGNVAIPKRPTNCTFVGVNGTTMLVTAQDTLYRFDVVIPGLGF